MSKDALLRLRLPADLKVRVVTDAEAEGVSASEWMRRAAEAHLMTAGQRGAAKEALEATPGPSPERAALGAEGSSDRAETATPASPRAPATIGKCWEPWCEKKGPVGEACPDHPKETFR